MKADDDSDDRADVERYEQLRRRALDGDVGGWRLGLAVLQHRGLSAWIRTCRAGPAVPTVAAPTGPVAPLPVGAGDALVAALASMAVACAAGD